MPDSTVIVAIVGAVGVVSAAWLTYLASGAGRLASRIESLEKRLDSMESERQAASIVTRLLASFVDRIGAWLEAGQRGPRPKPDAKLHALIDCQPWLPESPPEIPFGD